jgi:oxygen-independent coproporphyrinogen-3 oxidase
VEARTALAGRLTLTRRGRLLADAVVRRLVR